MKQVFLSGRGEVEVLDVPRPAAAPGAVLVRNACSLISTGTETAAITAHGGILGLYEKATASRDRLEQLWSMSRTLGVVRTAGVVQQKLADLTPIGYSCAGVVIEAADGAPFGAGDRVACMGAGFANHAEYVTVPFNLAARVPEEVPLQDAAFGSLACIALQGIRRLDVRGGENIGVIGLGLIGQIAVRLLTAFGCNSFGFDLQPSRVRAAEHSLTRVAWQLGEGDLVGEILRRTPAGLDGVLICAATSSDEPVNLAFDLCRPRGRVAVIGDVGLSLQRDKMYRKELDLFMSRSYGPGRYDAEYELAGRDYPIDYVRWTEKRNLECILQLMAAGKLELAQLATDRVAVAEARDAFASLKRGDGSLAVLLTYDTDKPIEERRPSRRAASTIVPRKGLVRLGLIGTGSFAKAVHIPNIKKLSSVFAVQAVASRSGSAAVIGRTLGAALVSSDYRDVIDDADVDAVVIATRHASHAQIVLDALAGGKHVFVEKPMAITIEDALAIERRAGEAGRVIRVGFNRRFAPMLGRFRRTFGSGTSRLLSIRVNIGAIANDWSNTVEEGGRLLGEGVHFFDFANWFMDGEPTDIGAEFVGDPSNINPNCSVHLRYADGSIADIVYTSLGDPRLGKEAYEAFGAGRAARCDDLKALIGAQGGRRRGRSDKGHFGAMEEFASAIRGENTPIKGADARAGLLATWAAIMSVRSAHQRSPVRLEI
ncbi:MAG TPA: Gfo/Idh/MocA family oxidoreductase [Thermoanaerobaculia bacterium]|nr:Gfo/Idh/MocA family oxidoreductase [Thermoanaerobaculia bacterium]